MAALPTKDRVIIAILVFFMVVALTLELYWIVFRTQMVERTDIFARLLSLYWPADRTYRDPVLDQAQAFTLAVEGVNTIVTQWFNAILIFAIVRRKPFRHWLQITVATYTAYGTVLYYVVAHLSGYAVMEEKTVPAFLMLYLANLPWLLGCGYMMLDSIVAIDRRFRT